MLENLFPILVIIVIIITSLMKRKKAVPKETPEKPSLWKQVIGEIMDQIEEKKEAEEIRVRQHFPEPDEEFLVDDEQEGPPIIREVKQAPQPPPIRLKKAGEDPMPLRRDVPRKMPEEPFEYDISAYSIKELEKAIVLSEIIGPPLAVRGDLESDRF